MSMENLPEDGEAVMSGKAFYMPYGNTQIQDKTSYLVTKRLLDMLLSFVGLIVLLPLFIVVGVLIKLEDPKGSVFLSKFGWARTRSYSTCINSAPWCPTPRS